MRINKLVIKNFKGIKELVITADAWVQAGVAVPMKGKYNINIFGDNATGKTTIADSFNWLLNGKDSLNRSDFGIKPIDPETQEVIHGIETEVEAVLDLGGSTLALKKVFYERWTKKRGTSEQAFAGNTTDYFVDGVPKSEGEYKKRIQDIADEKAFKLLTNPLYFNEQLHWTDRRKMLLQVCGDIADSEVIEGNSKLKGLSAILGTHSIDDQRKIIAAAKSKINDELEKIPAKITENKNMMPDTTGIVVSVVQGEIDGLLKEQEVLRQESTRITSGGEIAEKNKKLAEINSELIGMKNANEQRKTNALSELTKQEVESSLAYRTVSGKVSLKQDEISACERQIKTLETEIENLYEKYDKTEAETFSYREFVLNQDSVCPTCGQDIPQERLDSVREIAQQEYEAAKQIALEAFNMDKSNRLEKIKATGKDTRATLEIKKASLVTLNAEYAELVKRSANVEVSLNAVRQRILDTQASFIDVSETPEYKLKSAEAAQVKAAIAELHNGNNERISKIQSDIADISAKVRELQAKINLVDQCEKMKNRIEELKADEKKLAKEYERLEGELFITEEFIRTKVKMLDSKINSRFKYVRFKLFDVQINGALNECCEALINTNGCWTPYSDANAGGRINGGIDIINTLSEFYNFEAPIFCDNAESVTALAETKSQLFRLVVSEKDKVLRIETEAA